MPHRKNYLNAIGSNVIDKILMGNPRNISRNRNIVGVMLFVACGIFGFFGTGNAHAEMRIIDMRSGLHPDKTRIVVEISGVAAYNVTPVEGDNEILIDFADMPSRYDMASLTRNVKAIGVIRKVTLEDHEGMARIRISLRKAAVVDNSYILKPDYGLQYRLVFDLKTARPLSVAKSEVVSVVNATDTMVVEKTVRDRPVILPNSSDNLPQAPLEIASSSKSAKNPLGSKSDMNSGIYDDRMTDNGDFRLSGYVEVEGRGFPQSAFRPEQKDWTTSFALEPLAEYRSNSNNHQFSFRPFVRVDVNDSDRTHFDIRELKWVGTHDDWQVSLGIQSIFWGVTESNHLVDILNQDDNLEDIDQEDKLGQPMATLSYNSDFGVFSIYGMTYFREVRYPGRKGRFSMALPVDYGQTEYEANSDKWHADWAARWSHVIGNVDVGLYHFRGTDRDPELRAGTDGNGNNVLVPRYNLMSQTGLDLQGTFDSLLVKFEGIRRAGKGPDYWAMTGGFEYSFYGLGGGDSDIGLLAEYLYDDRGALATTPFDDDVFTGLRWTANDIDGTEVLIGAIFDLDTSAKFINFESSRRLGQHWKVSLDARFFLGVPMGDLLYYQSRDDFLQVRLARYF